MYKIVQFLWMERVRRWKQYICQKPLQTVGILLSIGYFIWILPGVFNQMTNEQIKYIALAANIYFWLKIVNSTQGLTVDYQLIQMKLITYSEFKVIILGKA